MFAEVVEVAAVMVEATVAAVMIEEEEEIVEAVARVPPGVRVIGFAPHVIIITLLTATNVIDVDFRSLRVKVAPVEVLVVLVHTMEVIGTFKETMELGREAMETFVEVEAAGVVIIIGIMISKTEEEEKEIEEIGQTEIETDRIEVTEIVIEIGLTEEVRGETIETENVIEVVAVAAVDTAARQEVISEEKMTDDQGPIRSFFAKIMISQLLLV